MPRQLTTEEKNKFVDDLQQLIDDIRNKGLLDNTCVFILQLNPDNPHQVKGKMLKNFDSPEKVKTVLNGAIASIAKEMAEMESYEPQPQQPPT